MRGNKMYLGGYNNEMKTTYMCKNDVVAGAKKDTDAAHVQASDQMKSTIVEMRKAKFNLGSNLPETNKYSISNLGNAKNFHATAKGVLLNKGDVS